MGASAHVGGHCPRTRTDSEPHNLFDHNVKATFVAVIWGLDHGVSLPLPLGEAQALQARGVHGLHRHVEYPTVADAVIETDHQYSVICNQVCADRVYIMVPNLDRYLALRRE